MIATTHAAAPRVGIYPLGLRRDLQGMRAFAVITVFADHLFGWPHGGFLGVDVFFVLSGFFITSLLIRERITEGDISFRDFYARRVRRIIPSAVLVIAATVIASYFLLTPARAKGALIDGLWATIFLSNWRFERVGTDYFAEGQPPSPLLHYWSLSIEEQFYFVWPLLLFGLFIITRRWSRPGRRYPAARQVSLAVAMGVICAASFGWACIQVTSNPNNAYFSTLTRVWELGVGALLAICIPALARIPDTIRPALSYVGFGGAVASLFVITPETPFPGPWALLPVLSTALVIAAFVGAEARAVPHLTNPVSQWFGETSYTLYLWHWPVIVLLTAVLPPDTLFYGLVIGVALALTALTYYLYENPIRRSHWLDTDHYTDRRWHITPTAWTLILAVVGASVLTAAVTTEFRGARDTSTQANQELVVAPEAPRFDIETNQCFGVAALTTPGCVLYDPQKNVQPNINDFADDTQGAYECYWTGEGPMRFCTFGYEGPDAKRIAVVGDSHAAMVLPALAENLVANKWNMTTFVGRGCQWMIIADDNCPMPDIQAKLLADQYDAVMVVARRRDDFRPAEINAFAAAWNPVAAVSPIVAVAEVPLVPPETIDCVMRSRTGGNIGECGTPRDVALSAPAALPQVAAVVPNSRVLDMTESYCNAQLCPAVIGNVIVYRDSSSHMTATYAKTLGPQLVDALRQAIG